MTTNSKKVGIFDASYRALTIGIILVVTTVAFEGLAITTIAPKLAQSLDGIHLYGWIFTAFLLSQMIGTMIMGQQIGRRGVAPSFIAAFSSAYILPALIGPYLAGLIAEFASWRFVFWCVVPFIIAAVFLTLPSFHKLQKAERVSTAHGSHKEHKEIYAIILTLGTGLLLTGLGAISDWQGMALAAAGVVILIQPLRKLLPAGSFSVRKGLPATIVSRGFYVACYVATESYVVLALTEVKGLSADLAGLIVAAGALSWSTAAWLQSKLDERDCGKGRKKRVNIGVSVMIVGVALVITIIGLPGGGIVWAVISQICTGFGIGLANPTTGAVALQHAEPGKEGEVSANLQFVDAFGPGLSIGIGGALIAISETLAWGIFTGIMLALSAQLLFILLSFVASFRITVKDG
ncbi:MFS transporter [Paenibacillus apiarius]|uniref:MFS transporter n=1 Tax=Paenibacillus apiarius TaxID=46240 RepID=UPI00197EE7F0|nr:MFS transporter [Paenibacillus apiarius]MBN3527384.1 MFS transporter [Paenibacillus apiarius]